MMSCSRASEHCFMKITTVLEIAQHKCSTNKPPFINSNKMIKQDLISIVINLLINLNILKTEIVGQGTKKTKSILVTMIAAR